MKKEINTTETKALALADIVQTTILLDRSDSMYYIWNAAIGAMKDLEKELDGNLLSIRCFNSKDKIVKYFDSNSKDMDDLKPSGGTNIYMSLNEAIMYSRDAAAITPEYKVHHVFVIITDGYSNTHSQEEYDICQQNLKAIDVDATFFLLDSSSAQNAGAALGLTSVEFKNTPESIKNAITKVKDAVNQMNENVFLQINPRANLLLPPAK